MRSCAFDHIPSRTTWRFSLLRPYLPGAFTSKLSGLLLHIHRYSSARMGFEPTSPGLLCAFLKDRRNARATLPFHMPLCSGSGNQLFTHISRLNGRGVRMTYTPPPQRFVACTLLTALCRGRIWQFIIISRYAVYFRTLGAIYTSKGSFIVCSLLKLGSRGVYVPLDAPICLFWYFYSAFALGGKPFALRTLKSGAPALRLSCPTGVFQTNDAQSLPPEGYCLAIFIPKSRCLFSTLTNSKG